MDTQRFLDLSPEEKVEVVNDMLLQENDNHLKNVAEKLGMSASSFSKTMRDNDKYQYNQKNKKYFRLLTVEEYKQMAKKPSKHAYDEALQFLTNHLEDLELLLNQFQTSFQLEPQVYQHDSKTVTKSFQINKDIYDCFIHICQTRLPHLRQKDIISQCLLTFCNRYGQPSAQGE